MGVCVCVMSYSPDIFETPKRRKLPSHDHPTMHTVATGQTLVLYKGNVIRADYRGIPYVIAGTSLCMISKNIAAGDFAYVFIQIDDTDNFTVITNAPGSSRIVFSSP